MFDVGLIPSKSYQPNLYSDNYWDQLHYFSPSYLSDLPNTSDTILLHYYQGMNIAEIAQMLELPEGTISSRLSRGRKKLESILLKGGDAR